jgi:hypothetical protein
MNRFAALIVAAATIASTPAVAATYSAKPAVVPAASRIIAGDISWNCGPDACKGSTEESRPAVLCQGLAKRAGPLTSFVANGRAFGAAELAKCNASAKGGASARLAKAN